MLYSITYRKADGSTSTMQVDVPSRADCFAEMKARGLVPISINEGTAEKKSKGAFKLNQQTHRGQKDVSSVFTKFSICRISLIAVVFVIPTVALWMIATVGLNLFHSSTSQQKSASGKNIISCDEKESNLSVKSESFPKSSQHGFSTLNSDKPVHDVIPSIKSYDFGVPELPDSVSGTPDIPTPPPVFNNVSDQVLAMAASADAGAMPPIPISHNAEAEFLASLKQEIVILDTDDERIRAIKETVKATREKMKLLIDNGMTVEQVLNEHQNLVNENAKVRNEAMIELSQLVKSGDIEGAKEYKHKISIALQQMGIEGLTIPVTEEERSERSAARRERRIKNREKQLINVLE